MFHYEHLKIRLKNRNIVTLLEYENALT